MSDDREILERVVGLFQADPGVLERVLRRRDRRRRNQRIAAGLVGAVIAIAIAGGGIALIRSQPEIATDPSVTPTPSPSASDVIEPADTEPTEGVPPLASSGEPITQLARGVFLVDITSGKASRLPATIASRNQLGYEPGQYQASPDGTRLLWWGESEGPGWMQVFVGNADGSGVRQVTHDPDGAVQGSWSPNGRAIVYVGGWAVNEDNMNEGVTIFVLDLRTGVTTPVITDRASALQEPRFSSDGRSIQFTRNGSSLWSVPVSGGSSSPLLEGFGYAEFSRDGSRIAFPRYVEIPLAGGHGGLGGQELWVANADGTDARPLAWGGENPWGGETGHWSPDGRKVAYNFGPVYVTNVTTQATTMIANHSVYIYDWLDDDTLIIGSW